MTDDHTRRGRRSFLVPTLAAFGVFVILAVTLWLRGESQRDEDEQLFEAIGGTDVPAVSRLLRIGANPNAIRRSTHQSFWDRLMRLIAPNADSETPCKRAQGDLDMMRRRKEQDDRLIEADRPGSAAEIHYVRLDLKEAERDLPRLEAILVLLKQAGGREN